MEARGGRTGRVGEGLRLRSARADLSSCAEESEEDLEEPEFSTLSSGVGEAFRTLEDDGVPKLFSNGLGSVRVRCRGWARAMTTMMGRRTMIRMGGRSRGKMRGA